MCCYTDALEVASGKERRSLTSIRHKLIVSHLLVALIVVATLGANLYFTLALQVANSLWVGFVAAILLALLLSWYLVGRFHQSVQNLIGCCRLLAEGKPLPTMQDHSQGELDNLIHEFELMAARLRESTESREQAHIALQEANQTLESRVQARISGLENANDQLKTEIENRLHIEALLAEAAMTDVLTGLLNRRAMMEMLGQIALAPKTGESKFSIILVDLDFFKRINDVHGHAMGDQVLTEVANLLKELQGEQRHAARWGGEEFLLLWPGMRLSKACQWAEELRRRVSQLRIGSKEIQITVSVGVAEYSAGEELENCLRRCDQALYRAKDAGRNTVVAAQGSLFVTMS